MAANFDDFGPSATIATVWSREIDGGRLCTVWFVSGRDGVSEPDIGEAKCVAIGTGRGHRNLDPSHTDTHQCTEFQQLQPDRATGRLGKLRVRQSDAPQST